MAINPTRRPDRAHSDRKEDMAEVYITSDVHGHGEGGLDEVFLRNRYQSTELEAATRLADIAEKYSLPITFFVSGRAATRQPSLLADLSDRSNVHIGGHTYRSHQPVWLHFLFDRLTGSFYGPRFYQEYDIEKTLQTLEDVIDAPIRSWRTHSFQGDDTTLDVLDESVVSFVSDRVGPFEPRRDVRDSLTMVPVNTPPDYDHLYRGWYTPPRVQRDLQIREKLFGAPGAYRSMAGLKRLLVESVKSLSGFRPPQKAFGEAWMEPQDYTQWLLGQVELRLESMGYATILLHPATMMLADEMLTADRIFRGVRKLASVAHLDDSP